MVVELAGVDLDGVESYYIVTDREQLVAVIEGGDADKKAMQESSVVDVGRDSTLQEIVGVFAQQCGLLFQKRQWSYSWPRGGNVWPKVECLLSHVSILLQIKCEQKREVV